jgi:hypothetical protein
MVHATSTEGEVSVWIACELEGVGVLIDFTRGFLPILRFLRRTMVSEPWVSDFSWPKVVYTNRYTNPA